MSDTSNIVLSAPNGQSARSMNNRLRRSGGGGLHYWGFINGEWGVSGLHFIIGGWFGKWLVLLKSWFEEWVARQF